MKRNYHIVKMPTEAYKNFLIKKINIEKAIKNLTGKQMKIPMTRIMKLIANKSIFIEDSEIKQFGRRII